jgi:cobalt/nickel transport system permease protein
MHIMEGFLPWQWCLVWWLIAIPFLVMGVIELKSLLRKDREYLPLLGVCGAFIFILSALKLPSVTGSCSHPTGTGLSVMCFKPYITAVIGFIVLLFQALLLAHGGLSTLGANMVSMAIGGPLVGYAVYKLLKNTSVNIYVTVFCVAAVADIEVGGVMASFTAFFAIFAITQVPLSIIEGLVLALVFKYIIQLKPDLIEKLGVFSKEQIESALGTKTNDPPEKV